MRQLQRPSWHPTNLLLVLAVWLTTIGNLPLWITVWHLPEINGLSAAGTIAQLILALAGLLTAFLLVFIWPRWLKPAGLILMAVAAASSHFMQSYGIVIDSTMIANVTNTDAREVRDLLSWSMLGTVGLGVVLPGLWWWRQPVRETSPWKLLAQQVALGFLAMFISAAMLWLAFEDLASLMRNHKSLRYMINPFNTVYALVDLSIGQAAQVREPLKIVGEDARLASEPKSPDASPLIVVVVGETARAANFGLSGYNRDTTPRLKKLQAQGNLVYFSDVTSCGTNTQTSVPCMLSPLGREGYLSQSARSEGLLDILQRAGLAVLWLDNQSGCKGVCDRVPHVAPRSPEAQALCDGDDCFDEILLHELPKHLASLAPERRAKGTIVVMHQMGSHGPAYYKRSPPSHKHFQPECTSNSLRDCPAEQLINAYDNSLRYTDHFLAETLTWLQAQPRPTALLYLSDHGESLGEKGLYLHGMPYRFAPSEQTHVPMVLWLSEAMQHDRQWSMGCVRAQSTEPLSHDNFFHTVLNLANVVTQVANPKLDILSPCDPKPH